MTISGQIFGIIAREGVPGCCGLIGCKITLMALRSYKSLHLPDFLGIMKIGKVQGLSGDFFPFKGNCSTLMGFCWSHFKSRGGTIIVALMVNFYQNFYSENIYQNIVQCSTES
jgi:hypothetical protein